MSCAPIDRPQHSVKGGHNAARALFNKGDTIDLVEVGLASQGLDQCGLAQGGHAFFDGRPLQLIGRTPVNDHLADTRGEREELGYGVSSAIAGAVTMLAPAPL